MHGTILPENARCRLAAAGAAVGLAAVAALAGCSQAAASAAPPKTTHYFELQQSIQLTGPDGKPSQGPPKPGSRIELTGTLYQGDHTKHSKKPAGTDHTICLFTTEDATTCDAQSAFGGALLLISSKGGDGDFDSPIYGGTGTYAHATGNVHAHPVGDTNNSDLTITLK